MRATVLWLKAYPVAQWTLLAFGLGGCAFPGWHGPPAETREVAFCVTYEFASTGRTPWIRVVALVPKTLPGRQIVREVVCSPEPMRLYETDDSRYAEFFCSGLVEPLTVTISGKAKLLRHDLSTARHRGRAPAPADLRPYLLDEPSLETGHPDLAGAAQAIQGADELDTVRRIYHFVLNHVRYAGADLDAHGGGAVKTLHEGKGDCTEYTDLMVALCRAKGIPARTIMGLIALPSADVPQHAWVEVYTRRYGWVSFDPTADDNGDNATFDRLKPAYLCFSSVRNDPLLDNYNSFATYRWWGDRVTLKERYEIRPLPTTGTAKRTGG